MECVTTNYDLYLEQARPLAELEAKDIVAPSGPTPTPPPEKPLLQASADPRDWIGALEGGRSVIYLHSSVRDRLKMIVSTRKYLTHYQDKYVREFLEHLFGSHTILFVAYGLGELEAIEHLVHAATIATGSVTPGHFWLHPVLSRDQDMHQHLGNYYRNHLGVEVVDYSINQRGHGELMDVIRAWSSRVPRRPRDVLDAMSFVDEVLADGTDG